MARLYTKPNDESRVGKTNVRSRAKEGVKDTVAAGNDGTEDELPSRNTGGRKKQSGSEDSTRRTTKSQEHIDDQEKLTAQLSDLSLTSKRNKKVQPAGGVNLERSDEEDVVRRLTQLRLQGVCHSDEEKETENNISDKAEDRVQNDKKGGTKYISSVPGRRSSDSEGQGEENIIGPTDADDTDGFDSLDDFIVSDNESLSLYEDSEFEDEEEEDDDNNYKEDLKENVKTHPPSQTHLNSDTEPEPEPQSRPRRRLIRGRRKPTCSSSPHALDNGTCDIAENTPGPNAEPLLSSNMENNTTCPTGQEGAGPDTDITTDLLSDFKLFLPPPISSTASEDFKNQNKAPMDLTPTKKMGKRTKNSSQGYGVRLYKLLIMTFFGLRFFILTLQIEQPGLLQSLLRKGIPRWVSLPLRHPLQNLALSLLRSHRRIVFLHLHIGLALICFGARRLSTSGTTNFLLERRKLLSFTDDISTFSRTPMKTTRRRTKALVIRMTTV